jgi:hypothetical protein
MYDAYWGTTTSMLPRNRTAEGAARMKEIADKGFSNLSLAGVILDCSPTARLGYNSSTRQYKLTFSEHFDQVQRLLVRERIQPQRVDLEHFEDWVSNTDIGLYRSPDRTTSASITNSDPWVINSRQIHIMGLRVADVLNYEEKVHSGRAVKDLST